MAETSAALPGPGDPGTAADGASADAGTTARQRERQVRRLLAGDGHPALNRVAALAARLLGAPAAQVSLLSDVQTVRAAAGLGPGAEGGTSPLGDSLCTVTAIAGTPLVVTDAATDDRVARLRPVTSGAVAAYLGAPLRMRDGLIVGALCVFGPVPRTWSDTDVAIVTGLADAAAAMLELAAVSVERRAERLHRRLATDAARVGTFDIDLTDGSGSDWDDRTAQLLGCDPTDRPDPRAFTRHAHPDDRRRIERFFTDAPTTDRDFEVEYRIVEPGGDIRWLLVRGRSLSNGQGRPFRLLGAALDITASRDTDHHLARVLDTVPAPFFFVDAQWRLRHVNTDAERILGHPRDKLVGGVLWELLPGLRDTPMEHHCRRAVGTRRPVTFQARVSDRWYEVRLWPGADGLSVHLLDVSERRAARTEAQAARRRAEAAQQVAEQNADRLRLLATVSAELSATLDTEKAVARLARLVVPDLGDWCIVSLADDPDDPARTLRDIGWWHADPRLRAVVERYGPLRLPALGGNAPARRSIRLGEKVVVRSGATREIGAALGPGPARDMLEQLAPTCAVFHPLHAGGRTLGLLSVFSRDPDRHVGAAAVRAGAEVAARAGLALDSARLYTQQRRLAAGLQRSMLTEPPQQPHLRIAVRYQPAADAARVGGDWYDAFVQPDGATVCVVGDVTGHDIEAAAAMGQVRALLRGIGYHSGAGPAGILAGLDSTMRGLGVRTTATAVVARLQADLPEAPDRPLRLCWSNAGHPPPVLLAADGSVTTLTGRGRHLLLGVAPQLPRTDDETPLHRGATVLLYTDGLVERRGQNIDEGVERLRHVVAELAHRSLDDLCDGVLARLLPERPDDDVALLAIRLRSAPAQAP